MKCFKFFKEKKNKKYLAVIGIVIFFLIFGKFIYERTVLPVSNRVAVDTMIGKGEEKLSVCSEKIIQQKFIANEDIQGIFLFFSKEDCIDEGNIYIEVGDEKEKNVLFETTIDAREVEVEQVYPISFEKRISLTKGNEYSIEISSDIGKGKLFLYAKDIKRNGCSLLVNKGEKEGNLSFGLILARDNSFLKYFLVIMMSVLMLLVLFIFWLIYFKHIRSLEIIYLISVLVLGIVYTFVMKPNAIPDELAHYSTACVRSNAIMHVKESELMDQDAADVIYTDSSLEAYREIYDIAKGNVWQVANNQRVAGLASPFYLHLFSGIGITLGRLMGIGNVFIFYLGRIFNLCFFAITTFYAVKKMPFCKMGMITICMFPMTMQLAASYSYDAVINGASFLFIAYIFDIIYNNKMIEIRDCVFLFITGLFIVSSKSGAYIPICLTVLFISKEQFLRIKKGIMSIVFLIGWGGWYICQSLSVTRNIVGGDFQIEWANEEAYRLDMIIGNPLHSIYVMGNTLWEHVDEWFMNIIGNKLGWFDIPILNIITFAFLFVFLISIIKSEQIEINSSIRWGLIVLSCISIGVVIGGMWLGWTPRSDDVISGVQGRYFLPILPMSIYFLQNNMLSLKHKIDNEIMVTLSILECITICNIFLVVVK